MPPYRIILLLCLGLSVSYSCKNDNNAHRQHPSATKEVAIELEKTAKAFQHYLDHNEFKAAANIATPKTRVWLETVERILAQMPEEADTYIETQFLEMNCTYEGNEARCGYVLREAGELIRDTFYLLKINDKWLVDIPEDMTQNDVLDFEQLLEAGE